MSPENDEFVEYPISGELDLHTFRPQEVGSLVPEYLREAQRRGYARVRIIHGKGRGTLRETVHHLLRRNSLVDSFRLSDPGEGGWGSTTVFLRGKPD